MFHGVFGGYTHSAPCPFRTTLTVFSIIFRSRRTLQFSIYSWSNLTTSSKSVISLRPLTCHIPVIPGFIPARLRCSNPYSFHSFSVHGRHPTNDIFPIRTLKNCGNSSQKINKRNRIFYFFVKIPWKYWLRWHFIEFTLWQTNYQISVIYIKYPRGVAVTFRQNAHKMA